MKQIVIYALYRTDEFYPRYIGQTVDSHKRLQHHFSDSSNKDKWNWMHEDRSKVRLMILSITYSPVQAKIKERYWIAKLTPIYNLAHSTTRKARFVAGRVVPYRAKPLAESSAKPSPAQVTPAIEQPTTKTKSNV